MTALDPVLIGRGETDCCLLPAMANRHGLIAGATGTGKTITLQVMAEKFSGLGVPVFLADIKGDLGGISRPGEDSPKIQERLALLKLTDYSPCGYPVRFWDVFGQSGHPVRATVSEMGPLLLSRLLNLNETQSGIMHIVFKIADDMGLLLLDMKDLQEMLKYVADQSSQITTTYGNVSRQSVGAIQRSLLTLEEQGGDQFFGEPALAVFDLIQSDSSGRGMINILAADRLFLSPGLYSTFLLWLMSELYEVLPEVGDLEKPKMVFFFDEAHLLFDQAPQALLDKVQQVVRLIRSKGVGIYFVTQNPVDIPDDVAGQLGNRVQHALRAYTPKEQKAVKAAAETFRPNPAFKVEDVITQLGVGEALISFLDEKGRPAVVEKAFILPPQGKIGPITAEQRQELLRASQLYGKYEKTVDRESAYELLQKKAAESEKQAAQSKSQAEKSKPEREKEATFADSDLGKSMGKAANRAMNQAISAMASQAGRKIGTSLFRGLLGSLLKK